MDRAVAKRVAGEGPVARFAARPEETRAGAATGEGWAAEARVAEGAAAETAAADWAAEAREAAALAAERAEAGWGKVAGQG